MDLIINKIKYLGGELLRIPHKAIMRQFEASTNQISDVQSNALRNILVAKGESLSDLSDLEILKSFKSRYDIRSYELLKDEVHEFIDTNSENVDFIAMTSGTTGPSKAVPVVSSMVDDWKRSWSIWGVNAFQDKVDATYGKILNFSGASVFEKSKHAIDKGSIASYLASLQHPVIRWQYVLKPGDISGDLEKDAAIIWEKILCSSPITMISVANASTLLYLIDWLIENFNEFASDLESRINWKSPIRYYRFRRYLSLNCPNKIILESFKKVTLCNVWTGGYAGLYLPRLKGYLENAKLRDHGLLASEGRYSIVLDDSNQGVLNIGTYFYEFIPAEVYESLSVEKILRCETVDPENLQPGNEYYIVVSSPNAMTRYDIGDKVRCDGFYNSTPKISFVSKSKSYINLTGEKVSEFQLVKAIRSVTCANIDLKNVSISPAFLKLPSLNVRISSKNFSSGMIDASLIERISNEFDNNLINLNDEYRTKRSSGRMAKAKVSIVEKDMFKLRCTEATKANGTNPFQFKFQIIDHELITTEEDL